MIVLELYLVPERAMWPDGLCSFCMFNINTDHHNSLILRYDQKMYGSSFPPPRLRSWRWSIVITWWFPSVHTSHVICVKHMVAESLKKTGYKHHECPFVSPAYMQGGAAHVGFGAVKDSKNFQEKTEWKNLVNWLSEAGYRKKKFLTLRSDNQTLN